MNVAVLIVNYRSYDALEVCLRSLEPELADEDEVIVVDYESDAAALARVGEWCPRALCLPDAGNAGFAVGINRAAARATADAVLLLNPDVAFDTTRGVVRGLADHLEAHDGAGVVAPRLLNADGTLQPSARGFPGLTTVLGGRTTWFTKHIPGNWFSRRNLKGIDATTPLDVDWVSGACLMTRRRLFESLGGLDEKFFLYWEDTDYCRRVWTAGHAVTYLPDLVVRHPGGGSSRHDLPAAMRVFHRSAFRYYWKHSRWTGRLAAPVVWVGLTVRGLLRARAERAAGR